MSEQVKDKRNNRCYSNCPAINLHGHDRDGKFYDNELHQLVEKDQIRECKNCHYKDHRCEEMEDSEFIIRDCIGSWGYEISSKKIKRRSLITAFDYCHRCGLKLPDEKFFCDEEDQEDV